MDPFNEFDDDQFARSSRENLLSRFTSPTQMIKEHSSEKSLESSITYIGYDSPRSASQMCLCTQDDIRLLELPTSRRPNGPECIFRLFMKDAMAMSVVSFDRRQGHGLVAYVKSRRVVSVYDTKKQATVGKDVVVESDIFNIVPLGGCAKGGGEQGGVLLLIFKNEIRIHRITFEEGLGPTPIAILRTACMVRKRNCKRRKKGAPSAESQQHDDPPALAVTRFRFPVCSSAMPGGNTIMVAYPEVVDARASRKGVVGVFSMQITGEETVKSKIDAHAGPLASIALTEDGDRVATMSEKGTIVRIFSCGGGKAVGSLLKEVRRGRTYATPYSLSFNQTGTELACFSSSGTLHLFSTTEQANKPFFHEKAFAKASLDKVALGKVVWCPGLRRCVYACMLSDVDERVAGELIVVNFLPPAIQKDAIQATTVFKEEEVEGEEAEGDRLRSGLAVSKLPPAQARFSLLSAPVVSPPPSPIRNLVRVVVIPPKDLDAPRLEMGKFVIHKEVTVEKFLRSLKRQLKLGPEDKLSLFAGEGVMLQAGWTMGKCAAELSFGPSLRISYVIEG